MDERDQYDIIVHDQVTQTASGLENARRAAEFERRRNPHKYVAIRDEHGVSTSLDLLPRDLEEDQGPVD
jgi:hypothetical protein